jgi:serine/threonine protein kinase HipA of HipAB toxin-antitoxin module
MNAALLPALSYNKTTNSKDTHGSSVKIVKDPKYYLHLLIPLGRLNAETFRG